MEISLLTMDVAAPSPGTASSSNSQPGDNASTFAQILSDQPQNAKKTASLSSHSPKEAKGQQHSEDKDKEKKDDTDLLLVSSELIKTEEIPQDKAGLPFSLPDNEQFAAIVENRTTPSLMSAEELAAQLPVQLTGLPGLKRTPVLSEHVSQALSQSNGIKRDDKLASLIPTMSKENKELADLNLSDKFSVEKSANKSLLSSLRPEAATLVASQTGINSDKDDKGANKKPASIATLFSSVTDKAQINESKSSQSTAKLADNLVQQFVSATTNSVSEKELHSTLTVTSSVTSHSSSLTQPQASFSPNATPVLTAQVGTQEWQQQLNQQIMMFSRNGLQKAELRLHPEELGSLHIRMKIEDGQAQLHLASQNGQVRTVLENALHHLRQAFSENGIQLTQSHVSSDTNDGWQQQNMSDSSQFSGNDADNHQGSEGNSMQLASETAQQKITPTPQELASARGGVDIFA